MPRRTRDARALGLGAASLLLVVSLAAHAQAPAKVYRIGYVQTATPEEQTHLTKAFEDGMRDLGYVEGRNVAYERRFAHGRQERLPELAAEVVKLKVDVIVTGGNPVIAAVKQATSTIPVVMAAGRDPVGSGFIASIARPVGNITGLTTDPSPEVHGKRLEFLKEALPQVTRVAYLWNPVPPGADAYRNSIEAAARKLKVTLLVVPVRGRDELDPAFAQIARERAEALVVDSDPVFFTARALIVPLAAKYRLPAIYQAREFIGVGGLMSYGDSAADRFRRAAGYVDKILKGAKPGELPVDQAAKYELVVNLGTARALGLTLPAAFLQRADDRVE